MNRSSTVRSVALVVALACCPFLVPSPGVAECVTLTPSQSVYEIGEPVVMQLENGCPFTIFLNSAPGVHIYDPDSTLVGPCWIIPIEWELYPAGRSPVEWDQLNCAGEQVPMGTYRARARFYIDSRHDPQFVETTFEIGPVPIEPVTWSRVKWLYRLVH